MKLRTVFFVSTLILSASLIVLNCTSTSDSPLSPTSLDQESSTVIPAPSSGASPGMVPTSPTPCDQLQVKRSSIKTETDCKKGVRFYVEAPGAQYYNIHLGGLNSGGAILGPNALGEWSKWYELDAGHYTYVMAVEAKTDNGIIQCDRHHGEFTIDECSTPKCVRPPEPKCEFGPAIYDPRNCTYTCPGCNLSEPPECQYGPAIPDYEACGWVCPPCVLPEPPQCEYGPPIPDREACDYTCPPRPACYEASLTVTVDQDGSTYCLNMDGNYPYVLTANGSSKSYPAGADRFCWQIDCEETLNWTVALIDGDNLCDSKKGSVTGDACEPDYCFYEVTGITKKWKCEDYAGGDWENWDNEYHHNHCRVPFPGISSRSFNLTPGQSETGCLRKQDDR